MTVDLRLGGHDIYMSPMALALGLRVIVRHDVDAGAGPSFYAIGYDVGRLLNRVRSREYEVGYPIPQPEMSPEA